MKTEVYYLKEELKKQLEKVALYQRKIKEEERRTTKIVTRVVIETKYGENCWRGMVLAELTLTLEQRDELIGNLNWMRKDLDRERAEAMNSETKYSPDIKVNIMPGKIEGKTKK